MAPVGLQQVQETNRKLSHFLRLAQEQESGPLRIVAADLLRLSSELRKMEQLRAAKSDSGDASLAEAWAEYRKHLENLAFLLPGLQARYAAEKARLERDRAHLQAASGWVQTQEMLRRR